MLRDVILVVGDLNLNTLRPKQNGRRFPDDIFKWIFLNENVWIPIKISLKFVPKGPINNIPALVQIMAWRRPGDKPLSEPMMVSLPTHICVARPQWVKQSQSHRDNLILERTIALCVLYRYLTSTRFLIYGGRYIDVGTQKSAQTVYAVIIKYRLNVKNTSTTCKKLHSVPGLDHCKLDMPIPAGRYQYAIIVVSSMSAANVSISNEQRRNGHPARSCAMYSKSVVMHLCSYLFRHSRLSFLRLWVWIEEIWLCFLISGLLCIVPQIVPHIKRYHFQYMVDAIIITKYLYLT